MSATVVNSTAGGDGGGLLLSSTTKYTLDNVLLRDNSAGGMGADCFETFNGVDLLIEDLNDCIVTTSTGSSNIYGVNPGLSALADNGGLTRTHVLLPSATGPEAGAFALAAPSRTTLSFPVATTERVKVAVFNVLGQRVLTVFDGLEVTADVQAVPVNGSGRYVVWLASVQGVATRQLTVVR